MFVLCYLQRKVCLHLAYSALLSCWEYIPDLYTCSIRVFYNFKNQLRRSLRGFSLVNSLPEEKLKSISALIKSGGSSMFEAGRDELSHLSRDLGHFRPLLECYQAKIYDNKASAETNSESKIDH